jgi:GcrA cell cycle regulator
MRWTDADKELLRVLVKNKCTLLDAARKLNRPKNAIAGMMSRLGLSSQSGKTFYPPKPKQVKKPAFDVAKFLADRRQAELPLERPVAPRIPVLTLVTHESTKDHYGSWKCQWPLGDPNSNMFRFCSDERVKGKPYCSGHCDLAYQKPKASTGRPMVFQKLQAARLQGWDGE